LSPADNISVCLRFRAQRKKIMKNSLTLMGALVAGMLMFSGCGKEGPAGPAGTDGTNGNANVRGNTFTISTWTWNTSALYLQGNIADADVTPDINNYGAVLVYAYIPSAAVWEALPFSTPTTSASVTQHFECLHSTGNVWVDISNSDGSTPSGPPADYKVVCIASSLIKANPNVDLKNYSQVKAAFHLNN